jgi:stage III sporulation protein AE
MGYVTAAGGMSAAVIGVSQFMSQFISLILVPIAKAVTCLGFCGSLSLIDGVVKLCTILKNAVLWCFGTASAIFLSVLGMQTTISVSADSLVFKTSKSVISGLIPVMGPLISETLSTANGCLNILKSGVGIYGILALCLSVLPILISLISWKICMELALAVGGLFCTDEVASVFKTVDFCVVILIGATVFTLLVYVISFGTILKSGG